MLLLLQFAKWFAVKHNDKNLIVFIKKYWKRSEGYFSRASAAKSDHS